MACPSWHRRRKNWVWQIVAGRVRPHEKQIRRTARAPGARCGASAARPTRRAADLRFRSARNARLAPACPDGRFDRMMTLFLRWRTSRTGRSGRRERARRPAAPPGPARRRAEPGAFSLHLCFTRVDKPLSPKTAAVCGAYPTVSTPKGLSLFLSCPISGVWLLFPSCEDAVARESCRTAVAGLIIKLIPSESSLATMTLSP